MSSEPQQTQTETPGRIPNRDVRAGLASMDWTVFGWSFGVIAVVTVVGMLFPGKVNDITGSALTWVTDSLGWFFVLSATGFVAFSLVLAFGRYGRIPLSQDGEEPEFSTVSWIAMMFSAGMGIGLMFFGVYEPVTHLASPPPFAGVKAGSEEAAQEAMAYTFFHWGLHPWAMYSVVGLALAYSTFRMGRGNLLSAPFEALFGEKAMKEKGWGKPIDILAIICTKFGSATSLGFGALQVAAGVALLRTGQFPDKGSTSLAIIVIMVLTVGIVLSAASGVSKGIKWLSNTNMVAAFLLVVFVFVLGPTIFILNMLPASIGAYLTQLVPMSFTTAAFGGSSWLASWTIFYWAWWISWTPFVGTFIGRISKGRTIREYVLGVLLVPTLISAVWFVVFGGAGLHLQLGGVDIASAGNEAAGFFMLLQEYPLVAVTTGVVVFLTSIFFVSGADAGALVLSTLSSRGRTEPWEPLVIVWAVMTGVVAAMLLLVGGLNALQTFTILTATPFVFVLIGLCASLYIDLRKDPLRQRRVGPVRSQRTAVPQTAPFVATPDGDQGNGSGQESQPEEATGGTG